MKKGIMEQRGLSLLSWCGRWRLGLRLASGIMVLASTLLLGQVVQAAGHPAPSPSQVAATLSSARSYQMQITAQGSGAASYALTLTVVGTGARRTLYLRSTSGAPYSVIARGNTTCLLVLDQWTCTNSPQTAVSTALSFNLTSMLQAYGASFHFTGGGVARTIDGQHAVGYPFEASSPAIGTSRGTLWLSPTTTRIIEEDGTLVSSPATGSVSTYSIRLVISRWNDPKLTIPSVPGL
jgi:hypothetical protein